MFGDIVNVPFAFGIGSALLLLWSFIWKGLALWKAAKKDAKWWFVALLVINTIGVLEILYIYVFSKEKGVASDSSKHMASSDASHGRDSMDEETPSASEDESSEDNEEEGEKSEEDEDEDEDEDEKKS